MSVRIYCKFQCDTPGCQVTATQEKPMPPPVDWGMEINKDQRVVHYCPTCDTKEANEAPRPDQD